MPGPRRLILASPATMMLHYRHARCGVVDLRAMRTLQLNRVPLGARQLTSSTSSTRQTTCSAATARRGRLFGPGSVVTAAPAPGGQPPPPPNAPPEQEQVHNEPEAPEPPVEQRPGLTFSDLTRLSGVFAFPHAQTATEQSSPTWLLTQLTAFVQDLAHQPDVQALWPDLPPSQLSALSATLQLIKSPGSGVHIEWLPMFGCALLPLVPPSPAALQPDHVALYLVVPDGWTFDMHSCPRSLDPTSHASSTTCIYSGSVPAQRYPDLLSAMHAAISKQQALKQKEKTEGIAATGRRSHFQRTPAFIQSAVQYALKQVRRDEQQQLGGEHDAEFPPPRGGFTDVGQHTGGKPKATTWPLLQSVVKAVLELCTGAALSSASHASPTALDLQQLLDQTMLQFELWVMRQLLHQLTPAMAAPAAVDACMTMLLSVAAKAAQLAVAGVNMSAVEAACTAARQQVDDAVAVRQLQAAAEYQLPADATAAAGRWRLPQGMLPPELPASEQQQGLDAARTRAAANLGSLPLAQKEQSFRLLLDQLLKQLSACGSSATDVQKQHALRSTERVLFQVAAAGFQQAVLSDIDLLQRVVDSYRDTSTAFQASSAAAAPGAAMLRAELRSREVLVVWVSYCLIHQAAAAAHSRVLQYGVALDCQDLKHLLLTDKAATDAALGVGSYLHQHSGHYGKLFHLTQQNPTLSFADAFAAADSSMCSKLVQLEADAAARMDKHWQQVQKQQAEARQLRREIDDLESQERSLESTVRHANTWESRYDTAMSRLNSVRYSLRSKRSSLSDAETPPPDVIQPLPRGQTRARQWLFFLHMPAALRSLARASCLAQQLLLPRPLSAETMQQLLVEDLQTSLPSHYNSYQAVTKYHYPVQQYKGSDGPAGYTLAMSFGAVPKKVGPDHIDSFYSREDGVWFPDSLLPVVAWQCSACAAADITSGSFFNPFAAINSKLVVESFTAQLPPGHSSLQWAMFQYGSIEATAADRGNKGLCTQDEQPDDLSKSSYLACTALRAFPHQQLQRLCGFLRDKELPLDHAAVQLLVQQTVFHLGQLVVSATSTSSSSSSYSVTPAWRTGWEQPCGVLETLCFELQQLAAELDQKPRDQGSVLLLGQLAAYLADWHPPCKAVAQQFARMTSRHANDHLQQQIDQLVTAGSDEAQLAELKGKQTRWRAMSLLCYAAGPLDSTDVGHMLRLMLLIKHSDVYQPDSKTAAQLAALRLLCHDVMARRLPEVMAVLQKQPQLLTAAAAAILECLQQQPGGPPVPTLEWQLLADPANAYQPVASFQAVGSDQHLYSINVLDGTLLLDGNPPGRLPNSILQHRLYVRTFGATNHEVKTTADGQLETIRPIAGHYYRFNLSAPAAAAASASAASAQPAGDSSAQLVITEIDPTQVASGCGVLELQLLDPGTDNACKGWGDDLPVRLRERHSHWFDRRHGFIVLRPKEFNSHAPHFLISCTPGPVAATYACFEVPSHLQQHHWAVVLEQHAEQLSARQLVLPDAQTSQVLKILSKFEAHAFIHTFMPGCCPRLLKKKPSTASKRQARAARGVAAAGMVWQLPRCSLEFELTAAGSVVSLDHRGYSLSSRQLLVGAQQSKGEGVSYTLPEFQQYLVLKAQDSSSSSSKAESFRPDVTQQLVLIPSGGVVVERASPGSTQPVAGGGSIHVKLSDSCSATVKVFKYAVHERFDYLTAPCLTSRLQLAALYAASSTLLPEPRSQLTGAQTAMQLVRHSWTNEPLKSQEQQHLQDTARMGGFLAPALRLLCAELAASAAQLQHLHVPETGAGAAARRSGAGGGGGAASSTTSSTSTLVQLLSSSSGPSGSKVDDVSEYLLQAHAPVPAGFAASPRQQLTAEEEGWLMHTSSVGLSTAVRSTPDWQRWGRYQLVEQLPEFPVRALYVQCAEAALKSLVETPQQPTQPPAFPLRVPDSAVPVAQDMMQELEHSWQCYHSHPEPTQVQSSPELRKFLAEGPYSVAEVKRQRSAAESFLLQHLGAVPATTGPAGVSFRLLVASAAQPTAAPTDLLALACGPVDNMLAFNPFLSEAAREQLRQGILLWMQLCLLEDRLDRVAKLVGAGDEYTPLLIRELCTVRTWDASAHPLWLVFEVEGRLQIRPAQHTMAQILLERSSSGGRGPIGQLNMGEGKTRVILPMMILALADGHNLVRVNFLNELLHEGRAHLQQYLTASVLGRKVLTMPFHRGIQVDEAALGAMQAALTYCQQVGGVLVVAPEHRNSMRLKALELALSGNTRLANQLTTLIEGLPYYDILDESDEVLHHRRRHLVYAWGDTIPLPGLQSRVDVVQSLLLVLSRLVDEQAPELSAEGLALKTGAQADRKPGSFCGLQLLPGQVLDDMLPLIEQRLATELIENAPLQDELSWLSNIPDKAALLKLLTDRAVCAVDEARECLQHPDMAGLPKDKQHQVLAARGLLACGLLPHCLQSRHRVDFGVNRTASAKKRLAVPYRAADLPSQRSEFQQPDVALVYSHLAYYGDGLKPHEFKQAVLMLLSRGPSEQGYHYNRWLAQGGKQTPGATAAFDSVDKIDPNNTQLMAAMWAYFSHNMETVNYYLATCVLPLETRQYPSRLEATAWHLAQSPAGHIAGFSGTNDSHRLLPGQVEQVSLDAAPELEGTNGKMLHMLMKHAAYDTLMELPAAAAAGGAKANIPPVPQLLLHQALQRGVHAIIDAGALLAGVNLRSAAEFILANMPPDHYHGVTYFCAGSGTWVILDTSGRLAPKSSSILRESETLAIYDQARCRGSDLKLRQSAVGLLTLASGMPKDTLMQAAGRLRQLGRGQTLVVMGLPDISSKILAAAAAGAGDVEMVQPAGGSGGGRGRGRWLLHAAKRLKGGSSQGDGKQPDMAAVLSWVMANTVAATLSGITETAAQGIHFAATYGGSPELCVTPEKLSVEELYGSSKVVEPVEGVLAGMAQHYTAHVRSKQQSLVAASAAAAAGTQLSVAASEAVGVVARGSSGSLPGDDGAESSQGADGMSVNDEYEEGGSSMSIDTSRHSSGSMSSDEANNTPVGSVVAVVAAAAVAAGGAGAGAAPTASTDDVLADIEYLQQHFSQLGASHSVLAGAGADEECERELEQEEEEEQEVEVEVPAAVAAAESDWDWASAFTASSTAELMGGCRAMPLRQALQLVHPVGDLRSIQWSPKVFASHNFVHSIQRSGLGLGLGLSDYMRPAAGLLCFPSSGELLLLSEREADALQKKAWDTAYRRPGGVASGGGRQPPNLLLSLSYLRLACTADPPGARPEGQPLFLATALTTSRASSAAAITPLQLSALLQQQVSVAALVSVQLFAGSVMYGSDSQRERLHELMRGRKEAAQELVGWRGKLHMLPRSDLDRACADDMFG